MLWAGMKPWKFQNGLPVYREFPPPPPLRYMIRTDSFVSCLEKPLSGEERTKLRDGFEKYSPHILYDSQYNGMKVQIWRDAGWFGEGLTRLYYGPDLEGRAGHERLRVMARHCIKQKWKKLGIWNDAWKIGDCREDRPDSSIGWMWEWDQERWKTERQQQMASFNSVYLNDVWIGPSEKPGDRVWMRPSKRPSDRVWPAADKETADEYALRLHIERRDATDVAQEQGDPPQEFARDPRESRITSRPWYQYELELAERSIRYSRITPSEKAAVGSWDLFQEVMRAVHQEVRDDWEQRGIWKDSWKAPGWRWGHESPSPEPEDINNLEFTPSEIDVLDSVQPNPPYPTRTD